MIFKKWVSFQSLREITHLIPAIRQSHPNEEDFGSEQTGLILHQQDELFQGRSQVSSSVGVNCGTESKYISNNSIKADFLKVCRK